MTLLAGDLGGTKTLLGLYDEDGRLLHRSRYESGRYASLAEMVRAFLQEPQVAAQPLPGRAALGVAGPVETLEGGGERARVTNLQWDISSAALQELGIGRVRLVNDFYTAASAAAAYRLGQLPAADLVVLNPGSARPGGALAVLGAGTGLGEALVLMSGAGPQVLPGEGGHSDFSPGDEVEDELLRFLRVRHGGHVSWERVLCGAGLVSLYEFFCARLGQEPAGELGAALRDDRARAPALVSQQAGAGADAAARAALERFVLLYGAEAGNLALKGLATGGVYLAGGIAAKILPALQGGGFRQRFADKGRFSALCASIPVHVMVSDVGLSGAAVLARAL